MLRFHQFLSTVAVVMLLDVSLKTNASIIQRDLIWTAIVFAGMAIWDYFAQRPNENQAPDAL